MLFQMLQYSASPFFSATKALDSLTIILLYFIVVLPIFNNFKAAIQIIIIIVFTWYYHGWRLTHYHDCQLKLSAQSLT